MFVFVSHLTVPSDDHALPERRFLQRSRLVGGFPGLPHLQLLRPQALEATYAFRTARESRDSFRRYTADAERETVRAAAGAGPVAVAPAAMPGAA